MLDEWLNWQTVDKADMRDIYEALAVADKVDVAHNAAISVTLELRAAAGRITSGIGFLKGPCILSVHPYLVVKYMYLKGSVEKIIKHILKESNVAILFQVKF